MTGNAPQYDTNANLRARYRLYRYTTRPNHFVHWAPEQITWTGEEVVLDVGCGDGDYLIELGRRFPGATLFGLDISVGMIEAARRRDPSDNCHWVVGDLVDLPLRSRSADVVMAMHMLYHVEDLEQAVRNLSLAVRETGVVLVGCNALNHLQDLRDAVADSVRAVTGRPPRPRPRSTTRFGAHNAEQMLSAAFTSVERRSLKDYLALPSVEPVIDYLASMRHAYGPTLPDPAAWDEVLEHLRAAYSRRLERDGELRIRTESALFLASGPDHAMTVGRRVLRRGEGAWA